MSKMQPVVLIVAAVVVLVSLISLNPKLHDKIFGPGVDGPGEKVPTEQAGTGMKTEKQPTDHVEVGAVGAVEKKETKAPKGSRQVVNKDDFDWINEDPDPNISVDKTIASVERYQTALNSLRSGTKTRSLEMVFHMGQRAAEDLVHSVGHMERAQYADVEPRMQGFILDRRGVFEVYPNYEYFEHLAQTLGVEADREFFQMGQDSTTNGISKYYNRITEFSTCTQYGKSLVVGGYQKWTGYQRRHPELYVTEVNDKVEESKNELLKNNCLCGDERSLYKEYDAFIKLFPKEDLVKDIQKRMADIKAGTIKVHVDCRSTLPEEE